MFSEIKDKCGWLWMARVEMNYNLEKLEQLFQASYSIAALHCVLERSLTTEYGFFFLRHLVLILAESFQILMTKRL